SRAGQTRFSNICMGSRFIPSTSARCLAGSRRLSNTECIKPSVAAEVDVVTRLDLNVDALRSSLVERLTDLGLSSPEVVVREVGRLERQGTGKLKRFIPLPKPSSTIGCTGPR